METRKRKVYFLELNYLNDCSKIAYFTNKKCIPSCNKECIPSLIMILYGKCVFY